MQKAYLGFTQVGWQRYNIGDGADGLRIVLDTIAHPQGIIYYTTNITTCQGF